MTYNQIIKDIENKIFHPIYLLYGEEPFYIDSISGLIEKNALTDDQKEFNQSIVYGQDTNIKNIVENAKRFPMMSNYQVLIIREAQNLEQIEDLADYAQKPTPTTILVLNYKYKKIDRRKSLAKTVQKSGILFESKKLYDDKIPDWTTRYIKSQGYSISQKAVYMLVESVGNDLSKITNEVNKILINLPGETTIDERLVEDYTGISKDYNVFELQKALMNKDFYKSVKIIRYFGSNPKGNPLPVVLSVLYNFFAKIMIYHRLTDKSDQAVAGKLGVNRFFVKDYKTGARNYPMRKLMQIISIIREYDLKYKGVHSSTSDEGELLKEMVYKIFAPSDSVKNFIA